VTDQVGRGAPCQLDFENLGHGSRVWREAPAAVTLVPCPNWLGSSAP
jgi:hypothetical protein